MRLDVRSPDGMTNAGIPPLVDPLLDALDARDGGVRLTAQSHVLVGPALVDALLDSLTTPGRWGLVLVAGLHHDADPAAWDARVATLLSSARGLAATYLLDAQATALFAAAAGSAHAVAPGTLRAFQPGVLPGERTDGLRHRTVVVPESPAGDLALGTALRRRALDAALAAPLPVRVREVDRAVCAAWDERLLARARPHRSTPADDAAPASADQAAALDELGARIAGLEARLERECAARAAAVRSWEDGVSAPSPRKSAPTPSATCATCRCGGPGATPRCGRCPSPSRSTWRPPPSASCWPACAPASCRTWHRDRGRHRVPGRARPGRHRGAQGVGGDAGPGRLRRTVGGRAVPHRRRGLPQTDPGGVPGVLRGAPRPRGEQRRAGRQAVRQRPAAAGAARGGPVGAAGSATTGHVYVGCIGPHLPNGQTS